MLTGREQQIVELLRRDPLLSAGALAAELGTSRASINVHVSNLGKKGVILGRGYVLAESPGAVVIGGANMDLKARSRQRATHQTSNPGQASMAPGGVARNIAENLGRLGDRVHLVSVVGRDAMGDALLSQTGAAGVRIEHMVRTDRPTGTYTAVLDSDGELIVAIADMEATAELGPEMLQRAAAVIASADLLVLDGNLSRETFSRALDLAGGARTVFDPVSVPKACGLKGALDHRVHAVTPNRDELAALTCLPTRTDKQVRGAIAAVHDLGIELVWVHLGARGSLLGTTTETIEIPALPAKVDDVTGAGDSMLAAFCHVLLAGGTPHQAARFGHAAAALTIASPHTVRPDLTARLVHSVLDTATDSRESS